MTRYCVERLVRWAAAVLQSAQVPSADADAAARFLVRSDLRGYRTHGLSRLASYMDRLAEGGFRARPEIVLHRDAAMWRLDADGAMGQVAARRVLDAAFPFLADSPMLWVNVHDAGHFGALGVFALEAAEAGYLCFLGQRAPPLLGLPGFAQPAIGNNPFAFGSPVAPGQPPLVFDMACSVAARGHILMAQREGRPIPPDWALDSEGHPTVDADRAAAGMLQPAGGYKGMGLAMMIECLAAAVSATAASNAAPAMKVLASGAVPRQNVFMFFLNPALAGSHGHFAGYMRHWIAHYRQSGGARAHIPGERGAAVEAEARHSGVSYSQVLEAELARLGEQAGVALADAALR